MGLPRIVWVDSLQLDYLEPSRIEVEHKLPSAESSTGRDVRVVTEVVGGELVVVTVTDKGRNFSPRPKKEQEE